MKANNAVKAISLFIIMLIVFFVLATSCTTYSKCVELYGVQKGDTVFVCVEKEIPVYIKIPADSAALSGDLTDLMKGDTLRSDTAQNISITAYLDEMGRINIDAKSKPKEIHDTIKIKEAIPCPPTLYFEKPLTIKDKIFMFYQSIAVWGFPWLLIFFVFIIRGVLKSWIAKK